MEEKSFHLVYRETYEKNGVLHHEYGMMLGDIQVGESFLRELDESQTLRVGNTAYTVYPEYRGRSYAALAIKELAKIAPKYNIDKLVICCREDNIASARSAEKAGACFECTFELPDTDASRAYGVRFVKRYFLDTDHN